MDVLSETSILKLIKRKLPNPDARVLVGFGDDAACYKIPSGSYSCITTDAFIENVHFSLGYFTFYDIGIKSFVSALSDIAAVGGTPSVAVVSLLLTKGTDNSDIDELYKGINETAKKYWVNIVGGDITKAEEIAVIFTVVGEIDKSNITLRSGAEEGDAIFVTGNLGDSYTGRLVLESGIDVDAYGFQNLVKKHLRPEPRIAESRKLLQRIKIHSMIDISDGLSTDILHIAEESRKSVQLEAAMLPISDESKRAANQFKLSAVETALRSGEEYELLFTAPESEQKHILELDIGIPITKIGKILAPSQTNIIFFPDGKQKPLIPTGYNHFG